MGGRPLKAPHLLRGSTGVAIAVLFLGGMALPLPIRAQDSQPTIQELQKEIRQRDELIRSWCIASKTWSDKLEAASRTLLSRLQQERGAQQSRAPPGRSRARPRSRRSIRESSRRRQRQPARRARLRLPVRQTRPRAAVRRHPDSSKLARTMPSAPLNAHSLPLATCWCRVDSRKSNPYSGTRAARHQPWPERQPASPPLT